MIEVYNRTENGKDRLVGTFNNYHDLFRGLRESDIKAFGYNDADRTDAPRAWTDRTYPDVDDWAATRFCYIAVEDGNFVTPDRLVGLFRDWWNDRPRYRYNRHGWNRNAYGSFRSPKTTNERRQVAAATVDDGAPPVRCARNFRNLPDAWDDFYGHSDRNWKTQSKRRHQYR